MKTNGTGSALRAFVAALSVAAAAGMTGSASADLTETLSDVVFSLEVSSALGSGSLEITQDMGFFNDDFTQFVWSLVGPVEIVDPATQQVIATLTGGNVFYQGDPQISMGFSMFAGAADTTVSIGSGTLGVGLDNPTATASAGLTLTDGDNDGASLTGNHPGGAYRASYNGASTSFLEVVSGLSAGSGGSDSDSGAGSGGIAGNVADMFAEFAFTLSANDQASGTSNYSIVPAPAALTLLAGGLLVGRRRRRI